MEFTSIVGLLLGIGVVAFGLHEANVGSVFLNLHGIVIVGGGTFASILFHCQWPHVWGAIKGFFSIFRLSRYRNPEKLIPVLVDLAEKSIQRGPVIALRAMEGNKAAGGFLSSAANVALQNVQNPDLVKVLLDRHVYQNRLESVEIVNVFRVGSVLSPMFGLIGTLLGIIQVLRKISDPDSVGAAMAVAITSAFYGISLANMICVPAAGKMRLYARDETTAKSIIAEAMVLILKGEHPFSVEQRLWAYLEREQVLDKGQAARGAMKDTGKAAPPAKQPAA